MNRMIHSATFMAAIAALSTGCTWDEGLIIENMVGTVVIPADLVERSYNVNGQAEVIADSRAIGPVYLGLYPAAVGADIVETYPHPATGPVFDLELGIGDAYPYGGTSIGQIRSTCLEAMNCKLITNRHLDWDSVLVWFRDYLEDPLTDWFDEEIESGEELRQICLTAFDFSSDEEFGIVARDTNGDEVVDEQDLDFQQREDGNFEASFTIFQQEFFTDNNAGSESDAGFTLWGFMDAPAPGNSEFDSCSALNGFGENVDQYNQDFEVGTMQRDVLNRPSNYISAGDVVSGVQGPDGDVGYVYETIFDTPELFLNFQVQ